MVNAIKETDTHPIALEGAKPSTGGVLGLVPRLLDYMSSPWRAITIIVLVVLCGAGYALWTERAALIMALARHQSLVYLKDKMQLKPILSDLLLHTHADLVMVWSIDFPHNELLFGTSVKRGDGIWPEGVDRLPGLTEASNLKRVVRLRNGEVVCDPPQNYPSNLLLRHLATDGYVYLCAVPVPPAANGMVLGILYIVWRKMPDSAETHAAMSLGRSSAGRMIER
jgi:hypothetical protein